MRRAVIAGNWKMHLTLDEAVSLVNRLRDELGHGWGSGESSVEVVVAPTYTALARVAEALRGSALKVSAQDLFWEDSGAYTGAVSALLVKDAGAEYVILGHSERRQLFHEDDQSVNRKIRAALRHNLRVILCVGESLAERDAGRLHEVITTQLLGGLQDLTEHDMAEIIVAYEPVWAIGTGKVASPDEAEQAHRFIRNLISERFGVAVAEMTRVIYGGSVKASNCHELLSQPNIDGALVGGASLRVEDFVGIIRGQEQIR